MNGFLLLIPFFIIRFILLSILNKTAVNRAAFFAPMVNREKIAYYIYQISNIGIFLYTLFIKIKVDFSYLFFLGTFLYVIGLFLFTITIINFSSPNEIGLNTNGIYKFSRNPMYVSYSIYFISIALLSKSLILLIMIIMFQVSSHWIILAEERWCISSFGEMYMQYMKKVKRYF